VKVRDITREIEADGWFLVPLERSTAFASKPA
jgi:hypothetical protein